MDYYLPKDAVSKEHIQRYYDILTKKDTQELIDAYNQVVKSGIIGVRQQGSYIKAIHQVFIDDFNVSPIYGLHENIIQLSGHLSSIDDLLRNPITVRLTLKNAEDIFLRLPAMTGVENYHVDVNEHLSIYNEGVVFYRKHISNTLFHCGGVSKYFMMKFDEHYKFETINFLDSVNRDFDISTQAKVAVVLQWPTVLPLEKIMQVSILGNF